MIRPDDLDFVDTLAVILCKTGKKEEAVDLMEKAAQLNPDKFNRKLDKFREGLCQ